MGVDYSIKGDKIVNGIGDQRKRKKVEEKKT